MGFATLRATIGSLVLASVAACQSFVPLVDTAEPPVVRVYATFDEGAGPRLFAGGGGHPSSADVLSRWDGSTWSNVGGAIQRNLYSPEVWALQPLTFLGSTRLWVGGRFDSVGGLPASGLASWDGATWQSVGGLPTAGGTADGFITDMIVFDDGVVGERLYVCGKFTSIAGVPADNIACWDGANWTSVGSSFWAPNGVWAPDGLRDLEVWDDGTGPKLYIAGGQAVQYWSGTSWVPTSPGGSSFRSLALTVHDDGTGPHLYGCGRWFVPANGGQYVNVARWDGAVWTQVGQYLFDPGPFLQSMTIAGTPVLVTSDSAGTIFPYNYTGRFPLHYWDGTSWGMLEGNGTVRAMEELTVGTSGGSELLVGGAFEVQGAPTFGSARFDGLAWRGMPTRPSGWMHAATGFTDPTGRKLVTTNGRQVLSWDGRDWSTMGTPFAFDQNAPGVHDGVVTTVHDGVEQRLIVGGTFTSNNGVPTRGIALWNGTDWAPMGAGVDGRVSAMCVLDSGAGPELYIAGLFATTSSPPGTVLNHVARWDGANWVPVGAGLAVGGTYQNQEISTLLTFDDGSGQGPQLHAGSFALGMHKWDAAAGLWVPAIPGLNITSVRSATVYDDGTGPALWIQGTLFTSTTVYAGVKWDGTTFTDAGISHYTNSLGAFDDGTGMALWAAGGDISRWDGQAWSIVGSAFQGNTSWDVRDLATFHDAAGSHLVAIGADLMWSQPGNPSLRITQAGPGLPAKVSASNLFPGHPHHLLVSSELCNPIGTGPFLGLCAPSQAMQADLLLQLSEPVGSLYHPMAVAPYQFFSCPSVPAGTYDVVLWDAFENRSSNVVRVSIQ